MFSTSDTIVAIATPPGRGGIGVVRISGPRAEAVAASLLKIRAPLRERHATLARIEVRASDENLVKNGGSTLDASIRDDAIVTFFPRPRSYTGEDVVEVSAHGSPVVLSTIVRGAVAAGARPAEPGEFTLRAYLNGRIDLAQAEAVADLVDAVTPLQARAAFDQLQGTLTTAITAIDAELFDLIARLEASVDFPEEGYHFVNPSEVAKAIGGIRVSVDALLAGAQRGQLIRDGLQVAIVGPPNAGKSSLFNAFLGTGRAIVTEVPGTTRDLVTETIDVEGLRVTLVDTAGLRETSDLVESEGVARSRNAAAVADLILVVLDRSRPHDATVLLAALPERARHLVVANKSDLPPAWSLDAAVNVSARTGQGLDELRKTMLRALDVELLAERPAITNVRHIMLMRTARTALVRVIDAIEQSEGTLPEELVLADLQEARAAFEEICGRRVPDDVLAHIFARFCVGK